MTHDQALARAFLRAYTAQVEILRPTADKSCQPGIMDWNAGSLALHALYAQAWM